MAKDRVDRDEEDLVRLYLTDIGQYPLLTKDDEVRLAQAIEAAGATILNTGIGWHEARIPTIATSVPQRAFTWVTKKLMGQVSIPVITSNRINRPEIAEAVLAEGCADMVSMARPFLADPEFVRKAAEDRAPEIAPCIACTQTCGCIRANRSAVLARTTGATAATPGRC